MYSLSYLPTTEETCWEQIYDRICPDDPAFYQGCGHAGCTASTEKNSEKGYGVKLLCETYLCHERKGDEFIRAGDQMRGRNDCDGVLSCQNTNIDEDSQYCNEENHSIDNQTHYICKDTASAKRLEESSICDDKCDCRFCDDESDCNGVKYGIECRRKYDMGYFVYSEHICDRQAQSCVDGRDEEDCRSTKIRACKGRYLKKRNLLASQICAVPNNRIVCLDGMDQVNCTDPNRVALTCEIAMGTSSVSIFGVCKNFGLCNDGYDDACREPEAGCIIHKNQICDGILDCPEGSDETHKDCEDLSDVYCIRRADMRPSYSRTSGRQELQIPLAWVSDQAIDCEDGKDEKGLKLWKICNEGQGNLEMYVNKNETCPIEFICSDGTGPESFRRLCDTVNSCGTENEMCSLSRGQEKVMGKVNYQGDKDFKVFSYCSKGLQYFQQTAQLNCSNVYSFDDFFSTKARFATSTRIKFPEQINSAAQIISCAHFYGEPYVYLSCSDQ